jgi:fumarate reductase flavoprotein subunit
MKTPHLLSVEDNIIILERNMKIQNLKTDVIVCAAGTAGLPAAVAAAEKGARVIVLEKTAHTGGAGNFANMIFGVESEYQKSFGPYLTLDEAFKTQMDWTHYRVDPALVMAIFKKSGNTIDWLKNLGVQFAPPMKGGPGIPGMPSMPTGPQGTVSAIGHPPRGSLMGQWSAVMEILTERAKQLGVKFMMKTTAKKLIKRGGRITGVIAHDKEGKEIRIKAKAVILACGGFSANKEMLKKYTGYEEGKNIVFLYKVGITGDGIRMAWEVGAAATPMMAGLTHNLPPPCCGPGGASLEFSAFTQPENLFVNLIGERFENDDVNGAHGAAAAHGTVANAIAMQKGKVAFMILDDNLRKVYAERNKKMPKFTGYEKRFKNDDLEKDIKEAVATGYKFLFAADSLEELCEETGINLGNLKKTLKDYNRYCQNGRDEQFNKDPKYLIPIKGHKYFAGKFIAGGYGTAGGIKDNTRMEVLDENMEPIPGLYVAGNDGNNMYDYSYTPLSGNYICFATNSGRIAAENAVEYIKSL